MRWVNGGNVSLFLFVQNTKCDFECSTCFMADIIIDFSLLEEPHYDNTTINNSTIVYLQPSSLTGQTTALTSRRMPAIRSCSAIWKASLTETSPSGRSQRTLSSPAVKKATAGWTSGKSKCFQPLSSIRGLRTLIREPPLWSARPKPAWISGTAKRQR